MIIVLTNAKVFGEPGPNLCWFGMPEEFSDITKKIAKICEGELNKVTIKSTDSIHLFGCRKIVFNVSESGKSLLQINEDESIETNLPIEIWKEIRVKFESTDELETFQFIEFDDRVDLVEDANWIIECRADEVKLLKQLATEYP